MTREKALQVSRALTKIEEFEIFIEDVMSLTTERFSDKDFEKSLLNVLNDELNKRIQYLNDL